MFTNHHYAGPALGRGAALVVTLKLRHSEASRLFG